MLDAHQGTVLLDVSALVGKERERQKERGGKRIEQVLHYKLGIRFPSAFLSLRTKQTPNREPLFASSKGRVFDAISLNMTEQTEM